MNSRRPINRVTSRRRPAAALAPAKKTTTRRVAGRPGPAQQRKSEVVEESAASGRRWRLPRRAEIVGASPWRPAVLCLIAAALLAAFAVTAAFRPGVDDSNRAYLDNDQTAQVKAAAGQVLSAVYGVDAKDLAGYKAAARKVLTGKALADSDKYLDGVMQAYQQTGAKSEVHTEPVGVTLLTADRAEVLANTTVGLTKDGVAQPSASGPILLRLEKVDGHWLASDLPNL
ncbi:hypothetical protein [Nocardia pseudobrasiliensis]|uniref:Mce-associated membrane protein n=1 Tax=Nocardia pseudobrasiliensis TaxID=45979 RepID=A0A370I6X5_9NOCA|nr:hypothetical protein [Nocardia pseudobrasiliensis]RDI66496.1 Mce-associated membrane protein [Nocardia pseudobrasiliensis]